MESSRQDRRALLSAMGAAAAGVALASSAAHAQGVAPSAPGMFTPAKHKEDGWLDQVPGKHRVLIDTASVDSADEGLLYAGNLFVANKSGYGLEDGDVATVVCLRHYATIFAYNNVIWAKYGKALADAAKYFDPKSAESPNTNPHVKSIEGLAKRGVQFAVCGLATRRFSSLLATATNGKAEDIIKELTANLVPNGHLMAAGVIATTRAQEYGYSLLVAG